VFRNLWFFSFVWESLCLCSDSLSSVLFGFDVFLWFCFLLFVFDVLALVPWVLFFFAIRVRLSNFCSLECSVFCVTVLSVALDSMWSCDTVRSFCLFFFFLLGISVSGFFSFWIRVVDSANI